MRKAILLIAGLLLIFSLSCSKESRMSTSDGVNGTQSSPVWMKETAANLEKKLVEKYGESQRSRVQRGLKQTAEFWRASDGDQGDFEEFVSRNFAGDPAALDEMFKRFEYLLEQTFGHMTELSREYRQQSDLDIGPIQP